MKSVDYFSVSIKVAVISLMCLYIMNCYALASTLDTSKAVIHHTASPDVSAKTIDGWHKKQGWKCIGYHFVIRADGKIEAGRPLTMVGAHAKGRNKFIGIALTGYDNFTDAQKISLKKLLLKLGVRYIQRHHEECPGKGLNIEKLQQDLNIYYNTNKNIITGKASFYTNRSNTGKYTANGEVFKENELTCAMKHHNFGGIYKVINTKNNKSVIVRHNDYGTLKAGRVIDLSKRAFQSIADLKTGIIEVKVIQIK